MKQPYIFLNMVIPGSRSPKQNIDVFLQPRIDELKVLWDKSVVTCQYLEEDEFYAIKLYVLMNCKEILPYIKMFNNMVAQHANQIDSCLGDMSHGPSHMAMCYKGNSAMQPPIPPPSSTPPLVKPSMPPQSSRPLMSTLTSTLVSYQEMKSDVKELNTNVYDTKIIMKVKLVRLPDSVGSIEENFWLQKSGLIWVVEGERNKKFFHMMVWKMRIRNHIFKINDSSTLQEVRNAVFDIDKDRIAVPDAFLLEFMVEDIADIPIEKSCDDVVYWVLHQMNFSLETNINENFRQKICR
ncbi:Uncharacterized protein TCM_012639 [Theobroma cacao]|uniref:Uncharacterized protein n=1 Tax=Theobroma cacao TaxID=3641 RepID=A0A061FWK8_THECC|nr:Uncharacterized protein TCM_012639 [Theobroma cacao]